MDYFFERELTSFLEVRSLGCSKEWFGDFRHFSFFWNYLSSSGLSGYFWYLSFLLLSPNANLLIKNLL